MPARKEATKMQAPLKSRILAFLALPNVYAKLDKETKEAIDQKKIFIDEEPLYVKKSIVPAGEIELLTANLVDSVGITNIADRELPETENFIIDSLFFGYKVSATAGAPVANNLKYSSLEADVPAIIQHADLIIKQGQAVIHRVPVNQLLYPSAAAQTSINGELGLSLKHMKMLKGKRKFQINLKFPEGLDATVADNTTFVWVQMNGGRTKLKGAD
jgi:hypothetical protein